eukprot:5687753-Pyramimonas_sp.AAC.1
MLFSWSAPPIDPCVALAMISRCRRTSISRSSCSRWSKNAAYDGSCVYIPPCGDPSGAPPGCSSTPTRNSNGSCGPSDGHDHRRGLAVHGGRIGHGHDNLRSL